MSASRFIEQESGTYTTRIRHPHNGYYAGDFSRTSRSATARPATPVPVPGAAPCLPHVAGAWPADRVSTRSSVPNPAI